MQGTKVEFDHNTPDQVRSVLSEARQLCEAEYEGDDYPDVVLLKVIDLLAAKTIQFVQPQAVDLGAIGMGGIGGARGLR